MSSNSTDRDEKSKPKSEKHEWYSSDEYCPMKKNYDNRFQVKQLVAVVKNNDGHRFAVYKTGDESYYFFQLIIDGTMSSDICFPVRKTELRKEIRSALANGWECSYHPNKGVPS